MELKILYQDEAFFEGIAQLLLKKITKDWYHFKKPAILNLTTHHVTYRRERLVGSSDVLYDEPKNLKTIQHIVASLNLATDMSHDETSKLRIAVKKPRFEQYHLTFFQRLMYVE